MIAQTTVRPNRELGSLDGQEWEVTEDGIEHLDTGYFIPAGQLASRRTDGLWEWPMHMAEKSWCASRPFRTAFLAALELYGVAADEALSRSFAAAASTGSGIRGDAGFLPLSALVRPRSVERRQPMRDDRRLAVQAKSVVRPGLSMSSGV